jgi:hypothetical protein
MAIGKSEYPESGSIRPESKATAALREAVEAAAKPQASHGAEVEEGGPHWASFSLCLAVMPGSKARPIVSIA